MSFFYVVGTPIGNLEDTSKRALRILSEVDLILCEDTRATKGLLGRYQIKTPLLSYHQHSKIKKTDYIVNLLREGKNLALVSDAGTPGISDPGNKLIQDILKREQKGQVGDSAVKEFEVKVVPVPGPSALTAAAGISGFPMDRFLFLGFLPTKKKRKKFLEEAVNSKYPVIFYESPYRIIKSLCELELTAKTYNLKPQIVVCRELTKKFETVYRGTINQVLEQLNQDKIKGEFVIVVEARLKNKQ